MNLNMRCQHCSESKTVEVETETTSAESRIETARANGWLAFLNKALKVPLYFCSSHCETKYKLAKKLHLTVVGSVTRNFYDSVFRCDHCGTWDSNDSGYTYNYRIMDGEQLGLNCGCAHEHAKDTFAEMANNPKRYIEREAAEELVEDGMLEHIERFIGGWTDGRGGSYGGVSTREGTPEGVMAQMLKEEPKSKFVISHDESGQFQSYFSIYRITKKGLKQNNKRHAA